MTPEQHSRMKKKAKDWFQQELEYTPKQWMIRWVKNEIELTAMTDNNEEFNGVDVIIACKRLVRKLIQYALESEDDVINKVEH